ncbi:MAG: PIG-L deacetylase family protein [Anaerolineaceae bacterium]
MPTLLAILAHPDDESYSFGGTLALASQAGWRCFVLSVTSGEGGKRHDGGPGGQVQVGLARERELTTSCSLLGVQPPEFWRLPDGHLREQAPQTVRLGSVIETQRPDFIFSLGPDGAYGHPDHIAVFQWLMEAWRSASTPRPSLLLAAFPRGLFLPQYRKCLSMMGRPPSPAASEIGSTAWQYEVPITTVAPTKLASLAAHRSQLPGGDSEALFPPGIVSSLLEVERFSDARATTNEAVASLLGSLSGEPRGSHRVTG